VRRATLDQIVAQRPVVRVTHLGSGAESLLHPLEAAPPSVSREVWDAAARALAADRSTLLETPDGPLFLHVYNTPLRLYVVGAVHIAQMLAPMAALAGFSVVVIDPRRAFATVERFPDVTLIAEWPDTAFARLTLDGRTAVVTLTHDPKLDDPALYVGALGSKKTHAARLGRLRAAGLGDAELGRVVGPVGLEIGARAAGEIAVSILAGVIAALRVA
jgi:xanthine dehydrogenase accessory factor